MRAVGQRHRQRTSREPCRGRGLFLGESLGRRVDAAASIPGVTVRLQLTYMYVTGMGPGSSIAVRVRSTKSEDTE